jgi:protein-tyrosine phosphatase
MKPVTDCHSHILPNADDGSRSVEESLSMLRLEAGQGIRRVVATPHFYAHHDSPERFFRRREEAWKKLREAMGDDPLLPKVELAAEVHFFAGMSDSKVISELTFPGKSYMLLEMPPAPWTESMYREMEEIFVKRGITPIIAHIDRYIGPFRTHGILKRLEELPVLVQANAEFFLQRGTSRMALRMLKEGRIHLLGSDCHGVKSRTPNLGQALELIEQRLGASSMRGIHTTEKMIFCPSENDF